MNHAGHEGSRWKATVKGSVLAVRHAVGANVVG